MRYRRLTLLLLTGVFVATGLAYAPSSEGREPRTRVAAFFSPDGGAAKALSERIRGAKRTLDVAMYVFSAPALATDVVAAHKRGVKVRVVLDGRMSRRWSQAGELEEHGVSVARVFLEKGRDDASTPQFHHKFAVVDGETVVTGSFNWTVMAERSNHENLLVIDDRKLARRYTEVFERALGLAGDDGD